MGQTEIQRSRPQRLVGELPMLQQGLEHRRATLLRKCSGLSNAQLRQRSCEPSNLSLLGLVRHLTEVERGWFLREVAGRTEDPVPELYCSEQDPDGDFTDLDSVDLEQSFQTEGKPPCSNRWAFTLMLEEYARYNGHSDLLRERIDGATGD